MLDYTISKVISALIEIFPAIFSVLAGVGIFSITKSKRTARIVFTAIMVTLAIMAIILQQNGILSEQDVDAYSEHTYFGQTKNNKPDGFGRLFDGDNRIYYCGDFKAGYIIGEGKYYGYDEETQTTYVKHEGTFDNGWNEGHVLYNEFIAGEARPVFDANYKHGSRYGQGKEYRYYDDGTLHYIYDGCFVRDSYWGYGVKTEYDENGNIIGRYSGSYTDNVRSGPAVYEFISVEGDQIVFVGEFKYDEVTEDGVYYYGNGSKYTEDADKDALYEKYPFPRDCIWK